MLKAEVIGKAIQNFRKEQGMSQEVLSSFADIGRTHLSAIECGERRPTLDTVFKLSYALGIKPSELIKAVEEQVTPEEVFGG